MIAGIYDLTACSIDVSETTGFSEMSVNIYTEDKNSRFL
jgi:hypothetical protein